MKTDGNGRKNLIFTSVSIFFGGNGIEFGKYGYGNGIGLRGNTDVKPERITRSNILKYTLTKGSVSTSIN